MSTTQDPKWQRIRSKFLNQNETPGTKDNMETPSAQNNQTNNVHILDLTQALYKIKLDLDHADQKKSAIDVEEMRRLKGELRLFSSFLLDKVPYIFPTVYLAEMRLYAFYFRSNNPKQ